MAASLHIIGASKLYAQRMVDGSITLEPLDWAAYNEERNNSLPLVFMRDEGGIHSGMKFDIEIRGDVPCVDEIYLGVEAYYADSLLLPISAQNEFLQLQPESHRRFSADGRASLVIRLLKLTAKDCCNRCVVLRFFGDMRSASDSREVSIVPADSFPIKVMSKNSKIKRKYIETISRDAAEEEMRELRRTIAQLRAENEALRKELHDQSQGLQASNR